jgi:hypothetical protein
MILVLSTSEADGDSSIRVTMDTYGHLISDAGDNCAWPSLDGLIFSDNIIPLSRDDDECPSDNLGIPFEYMEIWNSLVKQADLRPTAISTYLKEK